MKKRQNRVPPLLVVGGKQGKSEWAHTPEGLREFRIYRVRDTQTGEEYYAADYRVRGIRFPEHSQQRLPLPGSASRSLAWKEAQRLCLELDVSAPDPPTPPRDVSV